MTDFADAVVAQIDAQLVRFVGCSEMALHALSGDELERLAAVLDERERARDQLEHAARTLSRLRGGDPAQARQVERALACVSTALQTQGAQAVELQRRLLARAVELRAAISEELAQLASVGAATGRYAAEELAYAGAGEVARLEVRR